MQSYLNNITGLSICSFSILSLVILFNINKKEIRFLISNIFSLHKMILNKKRKTDKIWVISLDYDGTFDNGHQKILEWINEYRHQFDRTIVMIGSIRQSRLIDELNIKHNGNGSIKSIEMFAKQQELEFDSFLIGDVMEQRDPGDTYHKWDTQDYAAFKASAGYLSNKTQKIIFDNKNPIVHAQMHHVKECFPDDEIEYTLVDDKQDIGDFLIKHIQASIPPKVIFNFVHFNDNDECEPYMTPIKSRASFFDYDWRMQHQMYLSPCYPNIDIESAQIEGLNP